MAFCKPDSLKELQSFLGVINYFKDHLIDHSTITKPLFDIVALSKTLYETAYVDIGGTTCVWTAQGVS